MAVIYEHSIKDFTLNCSSSLSQIEDKNFCEYLLGKCSDHIAKGKTTWTIDTISGESFTFAQFEKLSKNVASALSKRGMRKGDIVVYMCFDIVKLHMFFNGVWRANGAVRSIYPEEMEDSVMQTVLESNCKWILCEESEVAKCLSVAKKAPWPVEVITMGRNVEGCVSVYDLFLDDGNECPQLETKGEDVAIILSTSGTTGRSKGAVYTHTGVISCLQKMVIAMQFAERNLFVSRGTHISGALIALSPLVLGSVLLTMSRVTLENVFAAVDSYKPDWIFAFPTYLIALANDPRAEKIDMDSFEYIYSGGTNIKPTLEAEISSKCSKLKFFSGVYGLTESAPVIAGAHRPESKALATILKGLPIGSMGKVCVGVSAQVRSENGTKLLGPNQEGELCIKNSCMFTYYYKQDEETKKAFTEDNWFRTGDIVSYDENGFIFYSGRQKEMFKCSGNHVFPVEIDEVISKHPCVEDVCTVGVNDPDGEKMPRAFVTLKSGTNSTADEIKEFAHKNLPTYKHLRGGLYVVPSLPKGTTGKVNRVIVGTSCPSMMVI